MTDTGGANSSARLFRHEDRDFMFLLFNSYTYVMYPFFNPIKALCRGLSTLNQEGRAARMSDRACATAIQAYAPGGGKGRPWCHGFTGRKSRDAATQSR